MDGSGERWDRAGIVGVAEITHNPNAFWKSLSDNRLTRLALALRSTLLRASSGATTTQTHVRERVRSFPHRMLTAGTGCVRAEARLTPAGSKMFAVVAARASRKVVSRSITARWTARGRTRGGSCRRARSRCWCSRRRAETRAERRGSCSSPTNPEPSRRSSARGSPPWRTSSRCDVDIARRLGWVLSSRARACSLSPLAFVPLVRAFFAFFLYDGRFAFTACRRRRRRRRLARSCRRRR